MFAIQHTSHRFEAAGLGLLALQLLLFLFGTPPFQTGIWFQTEPTLVAMFLLAALNAAWLGFGYFKRYLEVERPNIVWACLLAWVGWQWVCTFYATSSWRSWFGAVEIGEGAGWYTAILLCSLLCASLWKKKQYQKIILLMTAGAISLQCVLHWVYSGDPNDVMLWRPARWPDYLAFMAAYFWIAAMASGYGKKPDLICLLILFTYTVLYIASNMTGTLLIALAMLVSTLLPYPHFSARLRRFCAPSRYWRKLAIIACFLPMLWIAFSAGAPYLPLKEQGDAASTLVDHDDSMGARILLNRIALVTLKHEPDRLLNGSGWGNFTNDSFTYALVDGVRAYEDGIRKSNALHVNGSAFHSHSEPLEVLLSLGLPGLLLWFALPVIIIWRLDESLFWHTVPMLVAIVCLYYFWFALPQVMAYQAIALCGLAASLKPGKTKSRLLHHHLLYVGGLACIALGMLWSGYQQYRASQYSETVYFIPQKETEDDGLADWLKEDIRRGGDRLRVGGENFFLWAWEADYGTVDAEYHPMWHPYFLDAALAMSAYEPAGPRNRALHLWMQQKLLLDYGGSQHDYLRTQATNNILDSILQLTRIAPMREDLAAVFLMNLPAYTRGNIGKQVEILVDILKIHPNHRSALWLLGHIYLTDAQYEQDGEQMIRRAIAAGVDRVYPVSEEEMQSWQEIKQ